MALVCLNEQKRGYTPPSSQLLITGAPRSGTTWVAYFLKLCGVHCGHESVFTPRGFDGFARKALPHMHAECSWMAAPFLDEIAKTGIALAHAVRHPLAVIASLVATRHLLSDEELGFDDPRPKYRRFARQYVNGEVLSHNVVERCAMFWVTWTGMVDRWTNNIFRIEYDDPGLLLEWLGLDPAERRAEERAASLPKTVNTQYGTTPLTWSRLENAVRADTFVYVQETARRYGYPTDDEA